MKVQLIGSSTYHNMYGLIDDEGHTVGTKEVQLMTGQVHYVAWTKGHTAATIKQAFTTVLAQQSTEQIRD